MSKNNIELEARFLEIDNKSLQQKLVAIGAKDLGEDLLKEIIFYDEQLTWKPKRQYVRMRQTKNGISLSYKSKPNPKSIEMEEIEITVNDWHKTKVLLEKSGLIAYREQEKRRHSFTLDTVSIDIDSWPSIPPYVEIEAPTENAIKVTAKKLDLSWKDALFYGAGYIIENYYHIPVLSLRYFTFDKIQ